MQAPFAQRAASLGVVALLHLAVLLVLISQSATVRSLLPSVMATRIIAETRPKPPPPKIEPQLPPVLMPIPVPEVSVAPPPTHTNAPRAVIRTGPSGPPVAHFGAASDDAGLGIDAATTRGGGAGSRGNLGAFDAAVKQAVLAHKQQPFLAWDRRNTCTINYSVTISRGGALAALHIDPCAVPEINQAAAQAIRAAAPFPPPPDLGAASYTVHGTMIFQP